MIVIDQPNVHMALHSALNLLGLVGVQSDSRNGKVTQFPEPVATVYRNPLQRWLFWDERDDNPFFHFAEALWMLAGRNDVAFPAHFAKNIQTYSNDGVSLDGAYGYRWRKWFGYDQLECIIDALRENPRDRRQVLSMWDPDQERGDLLEQKENKDVPCNTQAFFSINPSSGELDMTVCNRSNDMVWGCYGANAVHFSYLQEYMSCALDVPPGVYTQVSNNLHLYENEVSTRTLGILKHEVANPYAKLRNLPPPLFYASIDQQEFDQALQVFLGSTSGCLLPGMPAYFRRVAGPILAAHAEFKEKRYETAKLQLLACSDAALALACTRWIERRQRRVPTAPTLEGE